MKKKTTAKTDALYSAVFRKKMATEWQKQCTKVLNCQKSLPSSKLQPMNEVEKLTRVLVAVEPRRPPMTDLGTKTAFGLGQRKHFQKSKHLLRSEVS